MHFFRTANVALVGICALAAALPGGAQELTATLTDVTFSDGASATGYFDYNPTTQTFGNYDITTTDGVTDTLTGGHYFPERAAPNSQLDDSTFIFSTQSGAPNFNYNELVLGTMAHVTGTGIYTLYPGTDINAHGFDGSGELAPAGTGTRGVAAGVLVVTNAVPAAVPEASTTVSFGVLLALGLGGVMIAARKKKIAVSR